MRKLLFLFTLSFLSLSLFSQEQGSSKSDFPFHRHQFQFGVGDPVFANLFNPYFYDYNNSFYYYYDSWFNADEYTRWWATTPALTAQYQYRFNKWFWLGGMVSYQGTYFQRNNSFTEEKIGISRKHSITIMPAVRFSWVNKKIVTLYSGVALGVSFMFSLNEPGNYSQFQPYIAFQITGVGVEVGKKWYGFAEVGAGFKGIVCAGFGFRFNAKKD